MTKMATPMMIPTNLARLENKYFITNFKGTQFLPCYDQAVIKVEPENTKCLVFS
jgi:hypothetical protein